jgi:[ribosomal protein S5]-alanine N-acetyltransferase
MIGRVARTSTLELVGWRMRLRTLTEDDYEGWYSVRARCRDWLVRWEPRPAGTPAMAEDRASFAARCAAREREGRLGGEITLSSIQRGPFQQAYIGYWIDEELAGNGLASEAVVVVLRYAFEELGLHRVEIAIVPRNWPSRRVVQKLGLREEGTAIGFLEIDGTWEDHVRYAVTSDEWKERGAELVRVWLKRS